MSTLASEKVLTRLISVGSALITIFVLSGSVTDPVNATKFLLLGILSAGIFGLLARLKFATLLGSHKSLTFMIILFFISSISSVLLSQLPLSQNIYGLYGRNSGLLTYIFLTICLIGTLSITQNTNLEKIIVALAIAGIVNLLYNAWVIAFGDFMGWENPYGNILGTLGNPNFIGAFLGMFFAVLVAYILDVRTGNSKKLLLGLLALITLFEIFKSHAIQGRVVAALGASVALFFYIRSRFGSKISSVYTAITVVIGVMAGLGALQIGPLTKYIYKYSVSLRGQYWLAGWNTGIDNPLHGVGMDGFGDWYRRSRDLHALSVPGVNTVVNAAHNVFIDLFAFGGWPLFISYLVIVGFGGISLIKISARQKMYDPVFVSISIAWLGYQLQSLISINQIGLAIWGWVLTGALIAYERNSRPSNQQNRIYENLKSGKMRKPSSNQVVSSGLIAGIFMVIGAIISSPPLASDMKWRSAQLARSVPMLEDSLKESFMNPQHTTKYLTAIQAFESSNLPELARKYSKQAVQFNPDNFELWKVFYLIQASTPEEKALALENMKRLDPLNPDVTAR